MNLLTNDSKGARPGFELPAVRASSPADPPPPDSDPGPTRAREIALDRQSVRERLMQLAQVFPSRPLRAPAGRTPIVSVARPLHWPAALAAREVAPSPQDRLEPADTIRATAMPTPSDADIGACARSEPGAMDPHALGVALGAAQADPRVREHFLAAWIEQIPGLSIPAVSGLLEFGRAMEGLPSGQGRLSCDGEFIRAFLARAAQIAQAAPAAQARSTLRRIVMITALLADATALNGAQMDRMVRGAVSSLQAGGRFHAIDLISEILWGLSKGLLGRSTDPEHLTVLFRLVLDTTQADHRLARFPALVAIAGGGAMEPQARAMILGSVCSAPAQMLSADERRQMVWQLTPHREAFRSGVRHLLQHAGDFDGRQVFHLARALYEEGETQQAPSAVRAQGGDSYDWSYEIVAQEIERLPRLDAALRWFAIDTPGVMDVEAARLLLEKVFSWDKPQDEFECWPVCKRLFERKAQEFLLADFRRARVLIVTSMQRLTLKKSLRDVAVDCLGRVHALAPQASDWRGTQRLDAARSTALGHAHHPDGRALDFVAGECLALIELAGWHSPLRDRIMAIVERLRAQVTIGVPTADRKRRPLS